MITSEEFFIANEKALSDHQKSILKHILWAAHYVVRGSRGFAITACEEAMFAIDEIRLLHGDHVFDPVMTPEGDMVDRPNHYGRLAIEPTRFNRENNVSWNIGNAIKYICRYPFKNGFEDVRKARRFLELEIKYLKGIKGWSL